MTRYSIDRLTAHHNVESFTSGTRPGAIEIDEYLRMHALVEQRAGLASVHLLIDHTKARERVAGYFALSPLSIPLNHVVLERMGLASVPYRSVGGYLLGRLGVDAAYQCKELGRLLVAAAIKTLRTAKQETGGAVLAVDPKNDALLHWYERLDFGFVKLNTSDATRRRLVL